MTPEPKDHASQFEPATRECSPGTAAEAPAVQAPPFADTSLAADPGLQRDRAVGGTTGILDSDLPAAAGAEGLQLFQDLDKI